MDVLSGTPLSRLSHSSGCSHRFCAKLEHLHLLLILLFKRESSDAAEREDQRPARPACYWGSCVCA